MDLTKLIDRTKNMLTTPKTEWPVVAAEPNTVGGLYVSYIGILAALPAIAGFIKGSLLGTSFLGVTVRSSIGGGLASMILGYALSLAVVYLMALIINALAPTFAGRKDMTQALKTVAFAWTASWIAGVGVIVPWLGFLIALAGGVYSIYLLYLGLPHTMQCPPAKAGGYTAVSVIIAIVLSWLAGMILAGLFVSTLGGATITGASLSSRGDDVTVDSNSALGQLTAMGERAERASKELDAAQKSGDSNASSASMGKMIGAMSGSGGPVEALAPAQIKTFLPDNLGDLQRTRSSAQRNGAMGMQISEASADYHGAKDRHITLEVSDTGGAKGLMAMAAAMAPEQEQETDHGYDKTTTVDGNLIHEQWDRQSHSGEYSVVVGKRFTVKATGSVDSIDVLKHAVGSVDLAKLASMKDAGVTPAN
jgi:hypothetical protein